MATETRTLTKDTPNGMAGGVCAGLADYFDVDPILVRALFVAATVLSGFSVVLYLVLWIALDDVEPSPADDLAGLEPGSEAEIEPPIDVEPAMPAAPEISQDPVDQPGDTPGT